MQSDQRHWERAALGVALDELEPGKELLIRDLSLASVFSGYGVTDDAAIKAARAFAEKHGCWLEYDVNTRAPPVFHKPKGR